MKLLNLYIVGCSLATPKFDVRNPNEIDQSPLTRIEHSLEKRDIYFCIYSCIHACGFTSKAYGEWKEERAAKAIAANSANYAWTYSQNEELYPVPFTPIKFMQLKSSLPPKLPTNTLATIENPIVTETVSGEARPIITPFQYPEPSNEIQLPALYAENPDWHSIIGPIYIEDNNIAEWIMFKKQPSIVREVMDRGPEFEDLMEKLDQQRKEIVQARAEKPWANLIPNNTEFNVDSKGNGDCQWFQAEGPFESEDGTSVHWFKIKIPPQGKEIPHLKDEDYQHFIRKSVNFRSILKFQ